MSSVLSALSVLGLNYLKYFVFRTKEDMTPLQMAIDLQLTSVVEALCKRGADVSSFDDCGNTPLLIALKSNQSEIASTLVSFQMIINAGKKGTAMANMRRILLNLYLNICVGNSFLFIYTVYICCIYYIQFDSLITLFVVLWQMMSFLRKKSVFLSTWHDLFFIAKSPKIYEIFLVIIWLKQ